MPRIRRSVLSEYIRIISAEYCASKFAVVGFNESLRREMKELGFDDIKTVILCPFMVDTGMFQIDLKFPFNRMILSPDFVARAIVEGLESGRNELWLPWLVYGFSLVRFLPTNLADWIMKIVGENGTRRK